MVAPHTAIMQTPMLVWACWSHGTLLRNSVLFFFLFFFLHWIHFYSLSELILSSTLSQAPSSLELRGPGQCGFIILPLSRCVSSDAIMINVNRAGFTVCLFYGAVGSAELGPSTRAPAGSMRTWTGRGFGWCFASRLGCNVAPCLQTLWQRLCCQSRANIPPLPWKRTDEAASLGKMLWVGLIKGLVL